MVTASQNGFGANNFDIRRHDNRDLSGSGSGDDLLTLMVNVIINTAVTVATTISTPLKIGGSILGSGNLGVLNPFSSEFAGYQVAGGAIATAGLAAGLPISFATGDIMDSYQIMIDSLHTIPSRSLKYAMSEPWLWTAGKLEELSSVLGGNREGGWVRQGGAKIMIARRHWGSRAIHLDREFTQLSELTGKIIEGEAPQSVVSAMAFFHCRFELIHPLHDGNGRVGRFIMACQAEDRLGVRRNVFLDELHAQENDYRMTFVPDDLRGRYELTFDLIARLTGSETSEEGIKPPFPIAPRYPEKKTKPGMATAKPKGGGKRKGQSILFDIIYFQFDPDWVIRRSK